MKFESAPLPTPSPSPPSRALPLPGNESARQPLVTGKHLARVRRAAEEVRLQHLAKALHATEATSSTWGNGVKMLRYSFQVEQDEGGKKALRKVTVIVPNLPSTEPDDARAALRQRPASSLIFIPPHANRAHARVAPTARRLSLPALSGLSLLSPPAPIPHFQSATHTHSHPRPLPPAEPVQQRRRAALSLRPREDALLVAEAGPTTGMERVAAWAREQCERVRRRARGDESAEEEEEEEEEEREGRSAKRQRRGVSLGERRGKTVQPLRLV